MFTVYFQPVDISETMVGESPDYILLSWTVVGENTEQAGWAPI